MLRGKVEFDCAGKFALVQSGSLVHVPAGTVHAFRFGRGGAAMIEFTGAGGAATRMFRHVEPGVPPGPPDIAKLVGILHSHGISVAA